MLRRAGAIVQRSTQAVMLTRDAVLVLANVGSRQIGLGGWLGTRAAALRRGLGATTLGLGDEGGDRSADCLRVILL
jgi:hypothetical protein